MTRFLKQRRALLGGAGGLKNVPAGASVFLNGLSYAAQTANAPYSLAVDVSKNLALFELHAGDVSNIGSERSELASAYSPAPGTTLWIAYSLYFVPGKTHFADWNAIGQMHYSGIAAAINPPMAVNFDTYGRMTLVSGYSAASPPTSSTLTTLYSTATHLTIGQWHSFVHQIKFDPTGSGTWNCWIDGTQVLNHTGDLHIGYFTDAGDYLKLGIYRDNASSAGPSSVYFANTEFGTTDLTARIAAPLPVPFANTTNWIGPTSGLVYRAPLDSAHISGSSVIDVVGGLNGTASGIGSIAGPSGASNSARSFNGSAYITLPSSPISNYAAAHSVFLWVNVTNIDATGAGGASQRLLYLGVDANNSMQIANWDGTGGGLDISLKAGATLGQKGGSASVGLANGTWAHVGYVFDGTNPITIYSNGEAMTLAGEGGFGQNDPNYTIGSRSASSANMTGSEAQLCVYNRAISADEVRQLYYAF